MEKLLHLMRWSMICLLCTLSLSACNYPGRQAASQQDANAIYTAAAETVQAQLTQVQQPPQATFAIPQTMAAPPPVVVTEINVASATSPSPQPPAPATAAPCDLAKFIQDISIPDNTKIEPGTVFTKTWRIQNAGSCTWTSAYGLVLEGENLLNAPTFTSITTGTVPPGGNVDISVSLTAPNTGGVFRQNFKLINSSGQKFGLGDGSKPFWAQIEVAPPGGLALDFLAQASLAEWRSGIGNDLSTPVTFNGPDEDVNGTAKIKDGAKLETGIISGKVLLTVPKQDANGTIAGTYPAYLVQAGDRLRGRIGFLSNADGSCGDGNVTFQIFYIDGGAVKPLAEWNKTCDRSLLPIQVDLSSLKGKTVQFMLVVRSGATFADDWAIWNSLRIER